MCSSTKKQTNKQANQNDNRPETINPRTYKGGGAGVGVDATLHKVFLSIFFLEDKTAAPDVFSSRLFIPSADFEPSLVMVGCYGYHIWRHKLRVVKPILNENTCFFNFFQQ